MTVHQILIVDEENWGGFSTFDAKKVDISGGEEEAKSGIKQGSSQTVFLTGANLLFAKKIWNPTFMEV